MATEQTPERTPQPVVVGVDPKELVQLVAATVAEALKGFNFGGQRQQQIDYDQLGQSIGANVASGIAATQRRKVSFGEYIARPHSYAHPTPESMSIKLKRSCFQNGVMLAEASLSDKEVLLLNEITHSGRYLDRFVEVAFNVNGATEEIDVRFSNATPDQRFMLREHIDYSPKRHGSPFEAMLEEIVREQKLEREEVEIEKDARAAVRAKRPGQGHIGGSKAYQEAVARREAKALGEGV